MRRLAMSAVFGMLFAGCAPSGPRGVTTEIKFAEVKHRDLISGPETIVPKWTGPDAAVRRTNWIQSQIEHIPFIGWEAVEPKLVAAGKASIPILIANLGRSEPAYRSRRAAFSIVTYSAHDSFELGEVVHDILVDIVTHFSNYRGDASKLPLRDQAAWEKWYREQGGHLAVGHRRD